MSTNDLAYFKQTAADCQYDKYQNHLKYLGFSFREVPVESGKRIAEKWKVPFVEASAKENQVPPSP